MSWTADKAWSDQYLPVVTRIVGPKLLEAAPLEQDRSEATDLMILLARDLRIGVRIRRPGMRDRFPHQITFRYHRDSGARTEWSKIRAGWCDWFFYGHADETALQPSLSDYWLVDLSVFREQLRRLPASLRWGRGQNAPENGSVVSFLWFDTRTIEASAIIDQRDQFQHEEGARRIGEDVFGLRYDAEGYVENG